MIFFVVAVANGVEARKDEVVIEKLKQNKQNVLTEVNGKHMSDSIKANSYLECASGHCDALEDIFKDIVATVDACGVRMRKQRCTIS